MPSQYEQIWYYHGAYNTILYNICSSDTSGV